MHLTGLIQRKRLFELATRWFANQLEPEDGLFLTQLLCYETLATGPTTREFFQQIQHSAELEPAWLERLTLKDHLRDAVVATCPVPSRRAGELFRQYRTSPEEFFPGTPTDMLFARTDDGAPRGMVRVKRIRRVAEKGSRRIADALAATIRSRARMLAEGRARASGVGLGELLSSSESMQEDFAAAEQIVSQLFRDRKVVLGKEEMRVDDVIGCKIIGTTEELRRVEAAIEDHPRTLAVEREVHAGDYNDTNLLVDLQLPEPGDIVDRMRGQSWEFAANRGLDAEELQRGFPDYVASGARSYRAEIILTSVEEFIESEFGRSIHEERIIEQRASIEYSGRIARNASFLIEYMLRLAISPTVEIDELPIVMWGRYLPDTFSSAVWGLYGLRHGVALMESFVPEPREMLDSRR